MSHPSSQYVPQILILNLSNIISDVMLFILCSILQKFEQKTGDFSKGVLYNVSFCMTHLKKRYQQILFDGFEVVPANFVVSNFSWHNCRNVHSAMAGHSRMNISAVAEGIMGRLIQCFN